MSTYSLRALNREYRKDKATFSTRFPHPFLLCEPVRDSGEGPILKTSVGVKNPLLALKDEPDPLEAHEVAKGPTPNAFPFGVTIGHSENNDIVLRHESVSRFHAYIQERAGRYLLFDAGSRNGTVIAGERLDRLKPKVLDDGATIEFGSTKVFFVTSERLVRAYLDPL